jgi:amino acid adenylation domain-containing protein
MHLPQVNESPATVLDLFFHQVQRCPDASAVEHNGERLSYAELDRRSAGWAEALRRRGVGPGHNVGLSVERGLNLAVSLLAIVRTGAAYVPLDPSYPKARLAAMTQQANVRMVLCDSPAMPEQSGVELIAPSSLPLAPAENLPAVLPSHICYVIFTSGSTGIPKGVMLSHGALCNLIVWQIEDVGFNAPARVLQYTPSSFDVHFSEFFGTWGSGGTLVMVADDIRRDPQRLAEFLVTQRIERLFLPYVAMQMLVDSALRSDVLPSTLRDIVTAGEQLVATESLRRFFQRLPSCRLHNHYGPSETHVATAYTLPVDPATWVNLPPIGTAIRNTLALVLDEQRQVITDGSVGELFLGGVCVADGYYGMPDRTAERFGYLPGYRERFYQTGDLARVGDDGQLYFLGRIDSQVKIRGYRVETAEIEMALKRIPGVSACAVVHEGTRSENRRLIAYLTSDLPAPPISKEDSASLSDWRTIWDTTYDHAHEPGIDPTFDIRGWNSSISGEPLPAAHMRLWVEGTRQRLLRERPRRVLEIGAGTGLILFALAPDVERYHAVDYSASAIRTLNRALDQHPQLRAQCTTTCCAAHEVLALPDLATAGLDMIIINSVTQHFESAGYLERVLSDAVQLLPQGGTVFVGDITCRSTRTLHFRAVESARAGAPIPPAELDGRVAKRLAEDQELLADAGWFYHLPQRLDRIHEVVVQLKPGGYTNEMSQFRFDVVLHVAPAGGTRPSSEGQSTPVVIPWSDTAPEAAEKAIHQHFANGNAGPLRWQGIPNQRLADARALDVRLVGDTHHTTPMVSPGLDPDACLTVADAVGVSVQTSFTTPGYFDAVFYRQTLAPTDFLTPADQSRPADDFISKPYLAAGFPELVKRARTELAAHLPDYMIPARYVLLHDLPMTPSGKLDRARLPEPSAERPALAVEYVAPQSDTEKALADVWQRVLELDRVGVLDNFFDLGGTSILSVQAVHEINTQRGRQLTIVDLFQHPTIRSLARHLLGANVHSSDLQASQSRAKLQQQALSRGRMPARNRKA